MIIKKGVTISMDHKQIFASNLKTQMELNGKSRRDVCEALGFSYYTFTDWVKGKKMPRMDKVEKLAAYFGILKSDLIEEKSPNKMKTDNDIISDIIIRLRTDEDFLSAVQTLNGLDSEKIVGVNQMLNAFLK